MTTGQSNKINGLDANQSVTKNIDVTVKTDPNLLESQGCHDVTVKTPKTDRFPPKKEDDIPKWQQLNFNSESEYKNMIGK